MIEAQETLVQLSIADWPRMSRADRESMHRKLHRVAYPNTYERPVSMAELAKYLGSGNI